MDHLHPTLSPNFQTSTTITRKSKRSSVQLEVFIGSKPRPLLLVYNFLKYGTAYGSPTLSSNAGTCPPWNWSSVGSVGNQGPPIGSHKTSHWRRTSDLWGSLVTTSSSDAIVEERKTSDIQRCSLFGTVLHPHWKRVCGSWVFYLLQVYTASRQLWECRKFQFWWSK